MEKKKNEFIEPENYWDGYQDSIDKQDDKKEGLALDVLCYAVFMKDENGKKLLELFNEKFINPSLVRIGSNNYEQSITFFEGFKQAFRTINDCIKSHEQRIKADNK